MRKFALIFTILVTSFSVSAEDLLPSLNPSLFAISPGQVDEVALITGDIPYRHDEDSGIGTPMTEKYNFGFLYKENGKIFVAYRDVQFEVLNKETAFKDEWFDKEIIFTGITKSLERTVLLEAISIPQKEDTVPAFWCSGSEAYPITGTNDAQSFFFILNVQIDNKLNPDPKTRRFFESFGNLELWLFRHPKNVTGYERFSSQYLLSKTNYPAHNLSNIGGFVATSLEFDKTFEEKNSLQRMNGRWRFVYGDKVGVPFHVIWPDMYCINTGGR